MHVGICVELAAPSVGWIYIQLCTRCCSRTVKKRLTCLTPETPARMKAQSYLVFKSVWRRKNCLLDILEKALVCFPCGDEMIDSRHHV